MQLGIQILQIHFWGKKTYEKFVTHKYYHNLASEWYFIMKILHTLEKYMNFSGNKFQGSILNDR